MKFILYRAGDKIDEAIETHELVAVEYGKDIVDVEDALIKAVTDDLAGLPEYIGCQTTAFAPEYSCDDYITPRYQYLITGIVSPPRGENTLVIYGIIEEKE